MRTIFDRQIRIPAEQRAAAVGVKDPALLVLAELGPAGAAAFMRMRV